MIRGSCAARRSKRGEKKRIAIYGKKYLSRFCMGPAYKGFINSGSSWMNGTQTRRKNSPLLAYSFPSEKTAQMNFPARALTPSRNDSEYDYNSNDQATDRVPETWGSNTPWQYNDPFQTALTPEPGPRFQYSLPSPPPSPFAPPPPSAPNFAYRPHEYTHAVSPPGTGSQDDHYLAVNSRSNPGPYYDSALASMDGRLGASLSRRRTGSVNKPLEAQGIQSSSLYVKPNPPQCVGPSGYSSGYFPSGGDGVADSEALQDLGNPSSSGDGKRQTKDRKRRRAH